MLKFNKRSKKSLNDVDLLWWKGIFLILAIMGLSCSAISNLAQPQTGGSTGPGNNNPLGNNDGSDLSYIGPDGNVWLLVNNNNLRITDFNSESADLPISSYFWSPDGTKIAVQTSRGAYIFDLAQSNARFFAGSHSLLYWYLLQPWSADSRKILVTQDALETLDLIELRSNRTWDKKTLVTPFPFALFSSNQENIAWFSDSQHVAISNETDINVNSGECSGSYPKIRVSIVDIQDGRQQVVYNNWGESLDVTSSKLILIGGDDPCASFPLVYDVGTLKMTKFDTVAPHSGMCLNGAGTGTVALLVSRNADAAQSILLVNTNDFSSQSIPFGAISKLTNFVGDCPRLYWSSDKKALFFNSDALWGGGIFQVDTSLRMILPVVGDKATDSRFKFDLQNSQIVDVLAGDDILVSGNQEGQVTTLYYLDMRTNQMHRLGDVAFWIEPSYSGQSKNGILAIQAKDIQTQATNIYLVNTNGDVVKTISNASQPAWRPLSR